MKVAKGAKAKVKESGNESLNSNTFHCLSSTFMSDKRTLCCSICLDPHPLGLMRFLRAVISYEKETLAGPRLGLCS